MQRARERTVRKYKRRYLAETEAGVDTTASAVKLRQARQELADFISATGGRADSARTSVTGFGRSASSKASWAAKGYEKQQKDVIIIENLRTAAKLPKAAVIHLKPTAINVDSLTFDDAHVNQERSHNISENRPNSTSGMQKSLLLSGMASLSDTMGQKAQHMFVQEQTRFAPHTALPSTRRI